jgi:hypothetical protein
MKIGFIISAYDEIDILNNTVNSIKKNNVPIIVIQSDPNDPTKILNSKKVDFYQQLSDLAGSKEEYLKERDDKHIKQATTPVKAVTRNFSFGFLASKKFDVDWWIAILADVSISNIDGIKNIIEKMIKQKKSIGVTRAIGQVFVDKNNKLTRIQNDNITDFMPQFFIVNSLLIKKGLFSNFQITNPFTTEQCLGDEVNRFCLEQKIDFKTLTYVISNYAYPQNISGLKYNSDRINMPKYVDKFVNRLRRIKIKYF